MTMAWFCRREESGCGCEANEGDSNRLHRAKEGVEGSTSNKEKGGDVALCSSFIGAISIYISLL